MLRLRSILRSPASRLLSPPPQQQGACAQPSEPDTDHERVARLQRRQRVSKSPILVSLGPARGQTRRHSTHSHLLVPREQTDNLRASATATPPRETPAWAENRA